MPPTVKPSRATAASFARVSVVMIASAASAPPSAESAATAGSSAGEQPVQRQPRADHAGREHEHLLGVEVEQPRRPRPRVASASSLPRSPVAAFATPELIDDRLRLGAARGARA